MNLTVRGSLLCTVAAVSLAIAQNTSAAIKCWTNNEGVRECGNVIPPEYAQKSHSKMNKQGIEVGKSMRAKTREELAEERTRAKEIAAAQAERDRLSNAQANEDRILLRTFATEEDILLTRDGHVAAIDSRIVHVQQVMRKIESNIEDLEQTAARNERRGDKIQASLLNDMENHKKQLEENAFSIEQLRKERRQLEEKYAAHLERYRELHVQR